MYYLTLAKHFSSSLKRPISTLINLASSFLVVQFGSTSMQNIIENRVGYSSVIDDRPYRAAVIQLANVV